MSVFVWKWGVEGERYIVVRVPAGKLASKHEVVSVLLPDGGGLDVIGPEVDGARDVEIIRGQGIDSETIGSLLGSTLSVSGLSFTFIPHRQDSKLKGIQWVISELTSSVNKYADPSSSWNNPISRLWNPKGCQLLRYVYLPHTVSLVATPILASP